MKAQLHRPPRKRAGAARSSRTVRLRLPSKTAAAAPVPLPREFAHIPRLRAGDTLHLVLRDGCSLRTVSGLIPGNGYLLSNGASVRAGTAIFYHMPDRCPARRPAEPMHHEAVRDFKIPSSTNPEIVYTVHVSETGMLVCNCGAGSYGRPCKHKRQVAELLERERPAA